MSQKRYHIDWPRTIAGALAAVAAAIVLSKLGAAGTLIGAAIGSLVISIGTNVGASGIHTTRERVLEAQREALRRVSLAQAEVRQARAAVSQASPESQQRLAQAERALESSQSELSELEDAVPTAPIPVVDEAAVPTPAVEAAVAENAVVDTPITDDSTQVLPTVLAADEMPPRQVVLWRRVAIFAIASFVVAILAITAFELISGRPLSSYTGGGGRGTSLVPSGGNSHPKAPPSPSLTPSSSPTPSPLPTSTSTSTVTPTPSATATPTPSTSTTPTSPLTPTSAPTVTNTP